MSEATQALLDKYEEEEFESNDNLQPNSGQYDQSDPDINQPNSGLSMVEIGANTENDNSNNNNNNNSSVTTPVSTDNVMGTGDEMTEAIPESVTEPVPTDPNEYLEGAPQLNAPTAPTLGAAPTVTDAPQFDAPDVPDMPGVTDAPTIPGLTISPAPEYTITPEEQAWNQMYKEQVQSNINDPKGISEEAQHLMMRKATLMLQSRETENLRLMANDMERKGLTDSGQIFERTEQIKATTTRAIAASITDIGIQSEMMKMESYERAMGHAASYLSYLSTNSQLKYGSKMATWSAQTQADMVQYQAQINVDLEHWKMENQFSMMEWSANKDAMFMKWDKNANAQIAQWNMTNQFAMEEWKTGANYDLAIHQINTQVSLAKFQAQTDIYKMGIAQAYQEGNMTQAAQIAEEFAEHRFEENKILAEMELEAENKAAKAEGGGNIIGQIIGGIFSIISPTG